MDKKFLQIDLLRDELTWEQCDQLTAYLDSVYEAQQVGLNPDLTLVRELHRAFLALWDEYQLLKAINKEENILLHNEQVLLIMAMNFWGASMTLEDYP